MSGEPGGGASRSTDPAAGSSSATDVSLREHLTALIVGDRNLNRERFAFGAIITVFAWTEIQRRLTNLNHEAARIQQAQAASVSSDTYAANEQQRDKEADELSDWRKEVDHDRTQSVGRTEFQRETKVERRSASQSGWLWVGGFATLTFLVLAILNIVLILVSR